MQKNIPGTTIFPQRKGGMPPYCHILGEIHGFWCCILILGEYSLSWWNLSSSFLPSCWELFFFSSPKTSKINNIWETHRQNTADFSTPVPWDSHRPEALLNLWAYSLQDEVGSHQCSRYFPQTKHRNRDFMGFSDQFDEKMRIEAAFFEDIFGRFDHQSSRFSAQWPLPSSHSSRVPKFIYRFVFT